MISRQLIRRLVPSLVMKVLSDEVIRRARRLRPSMISPTYSQAVERDLIEIGQRRALHHARVRNSAPRNEIHRGSICRTRRLARYDEQTHAPPGFRPQTLSFRHI